MKSTIKEAKYMDLLGLTGKKYLVTGASSGIGRAAAVKISQLGGRVVLNGRNMERLQQTLSMMDGDGHYVMPYDLTDLEGIKDYVAACIQTDGRRFDGLVFSTGIVRDAPIRVESVRQLQDMMCTNYYPYFELLKVFSSKRVLNDQSSIVAVSSASSKYPVKSQVSYAGSKAAIDAATIVASCEFAGRQVRVNSVQPEMTVTPMTEFYFKNLPAKQVKEDYPLGVILAEDVANAIIYLLSDMSSKITGQQIYISGGHGGNPIPLYDL